MRFTPDFSELNEDYKLPVAGVYVCQIVSYKSRDKSISWELVNSENQKVFHTTGLTGKGAWYLKQFIQAAYDPNYENGAFDADDLIGKKLTCHLGVETFLGQDGKDKKKYRVESVERYLSTQPLAAQADVPPAPSDEDMPEWMR